MQIKVDGKSVLIGNCRFNNIYLIDIDDNRIEFNDINHMVVGTADVKDFTIVDKKPIPIDHIEEKIQFENGATIICDVGSFNDIYQINKNALVFELINSNKEIDGRIYHFDIPVDIIEYDENGHLTGDVFSL